MSVRNRERPAGRLLGPRTRAPTSPLPAPPAQLTQAQPAFVPPPPPPPTTQSPEPEPTQDNNEVMPSYAQSQDAYARTTQPPPQPEPQPSASQPSPPPTARPPEPQRKNTADAPSSSAPAPLARRDTTASIGPPAYSAHPHPHQPHPRAPPPLSPTHANGQLLPSIPPPPPLQQQHMQPPTSATGATFLVPPRGSPAHTNGSLPSVPPTPTTPAHPHSRPSTAASSYPNSNNSTPTPTLAPAPQRPTTTSQSQRPGTATLKRAVAPPRPPLPPLPQIDLNPAPIPYKHLTLDAAQWTLSSADLQALVSAAIRESARERSIRLLAPNVQAEIDARLRALESEWDNAAAGWRFEGYRRGMLLSAIQSLASSLPAPAPSTSTNTLTGAPPQSDDSSSDTEALHALLGQLHAAMGRMDSHAGSLLAAAHARAGCERAVGTHKSSALAVALRKLNASYARRTKELGRERDRRLVAEGEVDEAWRVAEEVAAEVDRLRAEKRSWEERERELTDALAAFSNPARGHHRRGESSVSAGNGEGLRFVLTTEPEGGEEEEETRGRRLSLAMSEDVTSVSRLSRISRVSEAEVIPVTGKAIVSAARYVAGALSPTDEDSPSRLGDEVPGPIRETFKEGEGPTALIPGEEEGGAASVAASVGHGSDTEDEGQSVEVKTAKEDGDVPGTARPFPSTFHLPPAPTTSSPTAESSKGKEKASPTSAELRPDHKRHKRASTTSQVSRVSAARTRSMRASKASLSVRTAGGGQGERRVRRRASSVSSVPESGYGVEVKGLGLGLGRKRRGSVDALNSKDSIKVDKPVTVKTRERKDSDAFSIASASSAAASVQSRRREREKERMRAPPPVPALPVAGADGDGEGEEGSFLELGMMDAGEGESGGEKEGALGEGASASFRFSAPTPQHSYPPQPSASASTSTSTSTSRQSKPRRPRSPTTLTLLSAFVTPEGGIKDEEQGMSPAAPSSVAPFASVAPFPRGTGKEDEDVNGSTDILPSMSSSVSASAFASPASEHPPPESTQSYLGMRKLSIPHASGSGLANTGAGVGGAGSPLSPSSSSAGGLAYLNTPASPAGPRAPGSHVRGISAPGPRVLATSTSSPIQRRSGEKGLKGERTLTHSASQPLSGVVERERPKGAALRHSSAESGALVRSTTFGRAVKAGEGVQEQEQTHVASPEPMQGEESLSIEAAQDFSSPSSGSPPLHSPVHSQNPSTSSGAVHPYAPSPAQLNHAHSGSLASTRSSLGVVLENGSPDEFGLSLSSSPGVPALRPSRSGTFNLTRYAAPNSALEDDQWARGASDEWSRDGLSFDSGSGSGLSKATVGEDEVTATSPLVPRRGHSLELPSPGSTDGGARVRRSMSELLRFGLIGRRRPGSSGGGSGHGKSGSGNGSGGGKTPVKEHKDEGAEGILG